MQIIQPAQTKQPLCQQAEPLVQDGLLSRILLPTDPDSSARIGSYWCNNAKLRPACIVQPVSTAEVAKAVAALAQSRQPFAVRAGGHTNWAGSNNIADGVKIDLGLLNSTVYDQGVRRGALEPGAKWKDVYTELEKHGRVVAGGREAEGGRGGSARRVGETYFTHPVGASPVIMYWPTTWCSPTDVSLLLTRKKHAGGLFRVTLYSVVSY